MQPVFLDATLLNFLLSQEDICWDMTIYGSTFWTKVHEIPLKNIK